MAAYSDVSYGILPNKIVQAFIIALVTCKNEEDPFKNKGTRVVTTFLPLKVYGDFSRRSRAANSSVPGRILSHLEPMRDLMVVLFTCKDKEEPIKNERVRVVSRFSPL